MGNIWEILRTHHFSPTTSFEHEILLTPKISVMFWTLAQYRDRKKCWVSITRQCNIWKTKIIVGYRSSVPMMPTDGISDPLQNLISHKTWYFCFYCDAMGPSHSMQPLRVYQLCNDIWEQISWGFVRFSFPWRRFFTIFSNERNAANYNFIKNFEVCVS